MARSRVPVVHGTYDGYRNHACRCDDCRQAHTVYTYEYMSGRAERLGGCEVDDCPAGQYSRGLCKAHYERKRLGRVVDAPLAFRFRRPRVIR